jgi:pyruvate dehydrogenase E2 component (dihydrolipoamide acetyltransferase)
MAVLNLPDLGEGLQRAEIISWHVAVGDHVVTSQPLVAVETDKAVVDVPAPGPGTIARLCAAVGDTVEVGEALVEFEAGAAADSGTVVGKLETVSTEPPGPLASDTLRATPAVRALAVKLDVELQGLHGSGPDGAILSSDVEQAASRGDAETPLETVRGVRRAMAERMALAHAQVVPASIHADADIACWPADTDITTRLIMAIAAACAAEPALNAWFDADSMTRRLHRQVDLGVAVDTADGLFVPTLRNISERRPDSLREGLARIKKDVLARSIPPQELRGQTITLSNFGSIGGRYAELVVVPPQVAIVGTGRIRSAVLAIDDKPTIRRQLPLSLTFDHRAVTGAEAARFMAAMIADLEHSQDDRKPQND